MKDLLGIYRRDQEVLNELPTDEWVRPMDIGGRDGSHHAATLNRLVKRGLVEKKPRHSLAGLRTTWLYRKVAK